MRNAGLDVRVLRLPQVHDTERQGLITPYIAVARQTGVAAHVGDGANRWPVGHVLDAARLYALALDRGAPGARHNAVAEEGVTASIAEVVAAGLGVPTASLPPEEAERHFGWFGMFAGMVMPVSSAPTR